MMGRQEDANIYCVPWKEGTVLPEKTTAGTGEHMYSFYYNTSTKCTLMRPLAPKCTLTAIVSKL